MQPSKFISSLAVTIPPRSYTREFGKRLWEIYQVHRGSGAPRLDLRTRPKVNVRKSDRELFTDLALGDIWVESECHKIFEYLWASKRLRR